MICPSQSVWCNAVVLVQKKDRSLCFCIDFHHLNAHTKKDSYPLPRIQEALKSLASAGHFSYLDLKSESGRSIWMNCQSSTPHLLLATWAFFECDCMPFCLCNTPAMCQRLMQNCLRELSLTYCLIYLDVIIIFSWMAEEHLHCLCIIFDWFREHNLKLKPHPNVTISGMKSLTYPLSIEGQGSPQQLEPRSNCKVHPTTNIH